MNAPVNGNFKAGEFLSRGVLKYRLIKLPIFSQYTGVVLCFEKKKKADYHKNSSEALPCKETLLIVSTWLYTATVFVALAKEKL